MKILLLNANRVGVGTYHRALHFGDELARRGHDVTMMTVSNDQRFRATTRNARDGFRIIECPNWGDTMLPWRASGILDIIARLREVVAGNYDVIYAFEYMPNISVPALLPRLLKPFTLISDWCDWHAGASYHFGGRRWAHAVDRYFEEFIRHRADFVTTINRTLYERSLAIGIDPRRVAIIPEGVDPTYIVPLDRLVARRHLGLPPTSPIVTTIRDADRSAEILCQAVARSRRKDLQLVVVGSHPEPVLAFARAAGVTARVHAPGRVKDEELPFYLGAADICALPLEDNLTNRGRWPHKLGDMLAAQRPVVVSRGGEFPQLLENARCALTAEYDADAYARAFDQVLDSPESYEEMAARGRELIEKQLNWNVIGAQVEQVVKRAHLERRGRRTGSRRKTAW